MWRSILLWTLGSLSDESGVEEGVVDAQLAADSLLDLSPDLFLGS